MTSCGPASGVDHFNFGKMAAESVDLGIAPAACPACTPERPAAEWSILDCPPWYSAFPMSAGRMGSVEQISGRS
jgi:hypothetical protein